MFFRAESSVPGLARSERVHVYLDVSGSMSGVVKALYEALTTLLDHVAPAIHLLSTAVSDISHVQLKKGVLDTTGGTSIDVVTSHILRTKVKKALIVTDVSAGWGIAHDYFFPITVTQPSLSATSSAPLFK
jgi:hypothetical protein